MADPVFEVAPSVYKMRTEAVFPAYQWPGELSADAPIWVRGLHAASSSLFVVTRIGTLVALPGDWVVQEPDGALNVINNALFHATYEPVKAPDQKADSFAPAIPPREPLVPLATPAPPAAAAPPTTKAA